MNISDLIRSEMEDYTQLTMKALESSFKDKIYFDLVQDVENKKNTSKISNKINHPIVIETYSELNQNIEFWDYNIIPLDDSREFFNKNEKQRILLNINAVITDEMLKEFQGKSKFYNFEGLIDDITSILSLLTGRIFQPSTDYLIVADKVLKNPENTSFSFHPNLTIPVSNTNLEEEFKNIIDKLFKIKIKNKPSMKKLNSIRRALKFYRDSLSISTINYNLAYILLIVSTETLAKEFSKTEAKLQEIPDFDKVSSLCKEYNCSDEFVNKLSDILFNLEHYKLKAKFIDLIRTYIRNDFFIKKDMIYKYEIKSYIDINDKMPKAKIEFEEKEANFIMKEEQLGDYLSNIYNCRSKFVHDAIVLPDDANFASRDIISPLKLDINDNKKNKIEIPSYFWFERVVNSVIINVINKFGEENN